MYIYNIYILYIIYIYYIYITLNVNGLNAPTKGHRLAEWIQKQDPYIYPVYKKPTSDLKMHLKTRQKQHTKRKRIG